MPFTIATAPGVILPIGDSLPPKSLIVHSSVSPPNNVETDSNDNTRTGRSAVTNSASGFLTPASSVVPSSASASPTTSDTIPASFTSQGTAVTDGKSEPWPPAAIAGVVLLVFVIIGLITFFVRRHFVSRRASKVTPARSRASRIVISGPTNFQHVATSGRNVNLWNVHDKSSMNIGTAEVERWNPHTQPNLRLQTELTKDEAPWATSESPYRKNNQKYQVNFGALESGLHDHVRTMEFARNPRHDSF